MHVVEHEDGATRLRELAEQVGHSLEESVSFSLNVARHRLSEPGYTGAQLGQNAGELAAEWAELRAELIGRHVVHVVAQRLGKRLERRAELLVATTPQNRRALVVRVRARAR